MVRRYVVLAGLALTSMVGCHASPPKTLNQAPAAITSSDVSAAKVIALHNKNASNIRSLSASPGVAIVGERRGRANGRLAMERDRNFKLELEVLRKTVADIGSDDHGFWFWVDDSKDNKIYACDYEHVNASDLTITLQPDWIMEAMGLREFTPEEAQKVNAKPGEKPGTVVLTQFRRDVRGKTYTKETTFNEATGLILEHKLYAGAKEELIASAVISNYKETALLDSGRPDGGEDGTAAGEPIVVRTPERFRLNWDKEKFALDIIMSSVNINPQFSEERRTALFTEPKIPGATRVDLAQISTGSSGRSSTALAANGSRVYESKPIPQSGVTLGRPEAIGSRLDTEVDQSSTAPSVLNSPAADAMPSRVSGMVGYPATDSTEPDPLKYPRTPRRRSIFFNRR